MYNVITRGSAQNSVSASLDVMPTAQKDDRISLRIDSESKELLKEAADLLGVPMSAFIIQAAMEKARDTKIGQKRLVLSDRDRDRFLSALEKDTPNEDLQEAVEAHNELISN